MGNSRPLPKEEIILFTRQLALIIDSDVNLFEGLSLIKEKTDNASLEATISMILGELSKGNSLAYALKQQENAFTRFMVDMVEVGEKSGDLPSSLTQVADALERELEATSKVKSAITYPIILSVLMFGVILLLVLQVLPMFNDILESLGGEMPALTQVIINFSLFIGKYIWLLIIVITAVVGFFLIYGRTAKGKIFTDSLKFKLPIIKDITSSLAAVRFARNMAALLRSGLSMSLAIDLIRPVMNNHYVEDKLSQASNDLKQGSTPDQVIESLNLFPWILVKLFSVATQTGHMDAMLDKAADVMEKETDARLERLTTVIEPILIIILSLIVGLILISVILPIISIMNSIG